MTCFEWSGSSSYRDGRVPHRFGRCLEDRLRGRHRGVVKKGQVYEVPDDCWMLGIGITAVNKVVDDLFTYLAK